MVCWLRMFGLNCLMVCNFMGGGFFLSVFEVWCFIVMVMLVILLIVLVFIVFFVVLGLMFLFMIIVVMGVVMVC